MAQVLNEANNELKLEEGEQLELLENSPEQPSEPKEELIEASQPEEAIPDKYQNK